MALHEMVFEIPLASWNLAANSAVVRGVAPEGAVTESDEPGSLVVRFRYPHTPQSAVDGISASILARLPDGSVMRGNRQAIATSELTEEELQMILDAKWGEMS